MAKTPGDGPDHTLAGADLSAGAEEPPQVFQVVDLHAYVLPGMDEELSSSRGGAATYGTETVCTCVPVEDCVCNTVSYYHGGEPCPDHCACVGQCAPLYWFPY